MKILSIIHNHIFQTAVSRVISPESQTFQVNNRNDSDVMIVDEDVPAAMPNETASSSSSSGVQHQTVRNSVGYSRSHLGQPSTSRGVTSRKLVFKVSFNGAFVTIELPDTFTISKFCHVS